MISSEDVYAKRGKSQNSEVGNFSKIRQSSRLNW